MAATERAAERDLSAPPTTQGTLPRSGQIERKVPDDRARASLTCAPARLLMVKFGHQLADHRAASTLPPEYYVDYKSMKKALKRGETDIELQLLYEGELGRVAGLATQHPEIAAQDPQFLDMNRTALDKISKKFDKRRNLSNREGNRQKAAETLRDSLLPSAGGDKTAALQEVRVDGKQKHPNPLAEDAEEGAEVEKEKEEGEDGEGGGEDVSFMQSMIDQKYWLAMIGSSFLVVALTFETPKVAMWVGVSLAAYSAVANDSIQTLGILMAASHNTKWYFLWIYSSSIFVGTVLFSFFMYDGDVSHERLKAKGFDEAPASFEYMQVAAPIFLLILTRLKMPVSTTFLLLSCFATGAKGFGSMVIKSMGGYVIAFVVSGVFFFFAGKPMQNLWFEAAEDGQKGFERKAIAPAVYWLPILWVTSGLLWSIWLMQNTANIAVYLPRSLNWWQLLMFMFPIVVGLALIMQMGGDKVQEIVEKKSGVSDIRMASVINFIYGAILFVFQVLSKVPMSTTWVFVGLLAGRELAMSFHELSSNDMKGAWKLVASDFFSVGTGFVVSIAIAAASNKVVRDSLF